MSVGKDGITAIEDQGEGVKKFLYENGDWMVMGPDGETRAHFIKQQGTLNEILPGDVQRQTNADGTVITHYAKQKITIQEKDGIKISKMPGVLVQEDVSKGYKAMRFPDGFELIEMSDGTSIDRAPDGSIRTTRSDGVVVTTFKDGSKQVESADGKTVRNIPAPAPEVKEWT